MTTKQITIAEDIESIVHDIVKEKFPAEPIQPVTNTQWQMLSNTRTNLWLDTGDIDQACSLWCCQFQALTTNNTLLNREIQKGIYDTLIPNTVEKLRRLLPDITEKELILELSFILNAVHALRLVNKFNANVSVELHTDLANDINRSFDYALRYHRICPERFYIKIPLTPAGLIAARLLENHNVPVNLTLGFSARQAFAAALIANPHFVNVFLGRLNSFIADNSLGDGRNIGEKTTLQAQRNLLALRKTGKTTTHLIGASLRQGSQIATLAGIDIMTMPPQIAADYIANPGPHPISNVMNDPEVNFSVELTAQDLNADSLWKVDDDFKETVTTLLHEDIDRMSGDDMEKFFTDSGFGDFFPNWSKDEIETVTADGKIPVYKKWRKKLASNEIGLDALMNISALRSFATDQKALDRRCADATSTG